MSPIRQEGQEAQEGQGRRARGRADRGRACAPGGRAEPPAEEPVDRRAESAAVEPTARRGRLRAKRHLPWRRRPAPHTSPEEALVEKPGGTPSAPQAPATEPPVDRTPEPLPPVSTPAEAIRALADGRHQQPHDLLGHHLEPARAARARLPSVRVNRSPCGSPTAPASTSPTRPTASGAGCARARPRRRTTASP